MLAVAAAIAVNVQLGLGRPFLRFLRSRGFGGGMRPFGASNRVGRQRCAGKSVAATVEDKPEQYSYFPSLQVFSHDFTG